MKLLAILTFGLFVFFCSVEVSLVHDIIWPKYPDMRLMAFGMIWIGLFGVILSAAMTFAIIKYAPWLP